MRVPSRELCLMLLAVACSTPQPDAGIQSGLPDGESRLPIPGLVIDAESGEPLAGLRVHVAHFLYDVGGDLPQPTTLHKTILSDTLSADDGSFATGLVTGIVPEGRVSAVAWNANYAGFLDWSSDVDWELAHGQFPPLRVPVNLRGYSLEVEAREPAGTPVPGARVIVLPGWESWGLVARHDLHGSFEFPEFLQACGFLATTDAAGIARLAGLPYLKLEPDDCVYGVDVSSDAHLGQGTYYEIAPGETPRCTLDLTRLDELFISGIVVGESDEELSYGSILVDGTQVARIGPRGEWRLEWEDLGREPHKVTYLVEGYLPRDVDLDGGIFREDRTGYVIHLKRVP